MDAVAVLSQAMGGSAAGGTGAPLNAGLLLTIVGGSVTACLLALIVARVLRLHRTRAVVRSVGSVSAEIRAAESVVGVIEPKPRHYQRAA